MSAIVAWSVPGTSRSAHGLPRPLPAVAVAEGVSQPKTRQRQGAIPVTPVEGSRLRLTTLGRLVRSLVLFGVLALIALMKWLPVIDADQLGVDHHAVVLPGQTLTQIAAEHLPQLPVREAVVRLQLANNLSAPEVTTGQTLSIPAGR